MCVFSLEDLKSDFENINGAEIKIEQQDNDKGDNCHYNILNIKDKFTDKFSIKYFKHPYLYVCCGNDLKQISEDDAKKLKEYVCN